MSKFAYSATKGQFIADWRNNLFVNKIVQGAFLNRIGGSPSEKKSWEANAAKIVNLLELSEVLFEMRAACGYFGDGESIMPAGWIQVSGLGRLNRNMFMVRASGKSMEPQIHDGDYCVFRANPAGSRLNKIVLAQHRMVYDPDNGGAYSIKKYTSTKLFRQNGEWIHEKIVLQPLNHQFEPIEIKEEEADDFQIIGEYVGTISK